MSVPTRQTLREWNHALSDDAIDPADPDEHRYVKLRDSGRGAVDELQSTIELSFVTTTQLLSGPTGSGKTTELYRLRGELQQLGYTVTYLDLGSFVSLTTPVDVTEFLVALGLAAHDTCGPLARDVDFGQRFARLLSRLHVELEVAGIAAEASAQGVKLSGFGSSVAVDLKGELKSSEPFVHQLRDKLAYHVGALYTDVAAFLAELAVATTGDGVEPAGHVLIVDGLERLRGTTDNDGAVQQSVERLFVGHADKMRFPSHHVVYSVPTSLRFTNPGALPYDSPVVPVPTPAVWEHGPATAAAVQQSRRQLVEVLNLRLPVKEVFGDDDALVQTVVQASGGHLRDLFKIVRQVIGLVLRRSLELPLQRESVEEAIHQLEHDFGSATAEQRDFLARVQRSGGRLVPTAAEVGLMARLLQTHMLLSHLNGSDWYEVHPLARRALALE